MENWIKILELRLLNVSSINRPIVAKNKERRILLWKKRNIDFQEIP